MIWCFNEHRDIPLGVKCFVENASGQPIKNIPVQDINQFLTEYDDFCEKTNTSVFPEYLK